MNKQEALQKIKELQEYIEECDKRPDVAIGQLYRNDYNGSIYLVANPEDGTARNEEFKLITVKGGYIIGNTWAGDDGFGHSERDFTYIGMASDLLTVKT